MNTFAVRPGTDLAIRFQLADDQGNPITSYTGSEALQAKLWPGGTLAPVATPTAAWISGPAGTISVVTSATQTLGLAEGRYQGALSVQDPIIGWVEAVRWAVDALQAAGSDAIAPSYCDFPDLLKYARSWLRGLQTEDDDAGFSTQCGRARSWFDDLIINRWQVAMPIGVGDPGYGAVLVGQNPGQLPSKWLRDQLDAGALIVRDSVVECNAKKALAFICESQIGPGDAGNQFAKLGRWYHREADGIARTIRAEIDSNQDGWPEFAVNLGQLSMRA